MPHTLIDCSRRPHWCGRTSCSLDLRPTVSSRTSFLGTFRGKCSSQKLTFREAVKHKKCCASLESDAPYALAIGACLLSTLALPDSEDKTKKEDDLFGPDGVRSGAMQVISFIPLFNWLTWIFAYLDSGKQRYLAFAAVYLAPYLKTGLSLNPEDSWLPIASVLACIVHVQLDISIAAEGSEPPLIDFPKLIREKSNLKSLRVRTEGLMSRLNALAEKAGTRKIEQALEESDAKSLEDWKAIKEEQVREELRAFDERLARSETRRPEVVGEDASGEVREK